MTGQRPITSISPFFWIYWESRRQGLSNRKCWKHPGARLLRCWPSPASLKKLPNCTIWLRNGTSGEIDFIQGPDLFFQGRQHAPRVWLNYLPAEFVKKDPWLLFWQAVGLIPLTPLKGCKCCEQAFEKFVHNGDYFDQVLSFAAAVESFLCSAAICWDLTAGFVKECDWVVN